MNSVNALVLTGYGLNCDIETAHAIELAGGRADRVHINALIDGEARLDAYQMITFVGGFSWGDDHGAGVVQAVRLKTHIGEQLLRFIAAGKLVLGICNGFQTLVNLGLLPGLDADYQTRSVALAANDCGNFRDQWVSLGVNPQSPCVFTRGLTHLELPVRHGEGKFFAEPGTLEKLLRQHQVVLRYVLPDGTPAGGLFPDNPNGSLHDIAGICDPSGRVFGLMPHPEAYHHWTHHPRWTRLREEHRRTGKPLDAAGAEGNLIFKNAVAFLQT
jgi:phosphoribosylformylglycinamidine synthase